MMWIEGDGSCKSEKCPRELTRHYREPVVLFSWQYGREEPICIFMFQDKEAKLIDEMVFDIEVADRALACLLEFSTCEIRNPRTLNFILLSSYVLHANY